MSSTRFCSSVYMNTCHYGSSAALARRGAGREGAGSALLGCGLLRETARYYRGAQTLL